MIGRMAGGLVLLGLVAGCGGGGDGGSGGNGGLSRLQAASYEERARWYDANDDAIWDMPIIEPSAVQTSGTVRYDGYIYHDLNPVTQEGAPEGADTTRWLSGLMTATVDFGSNSLTASARDFREEDNRAWTGQLTSSNDFVDRTVNPAADWTLGSYLDGVLVDAEGNTWEVETSWGAHLAGDYMRGLTAGIFTSHGLQSVIYTDTGDLILRRNP